METYTTNEGITHCSSCSSALSKSEIETENCSHCWQNENGNYDDEYYENSPHEDCPKCGRTFDDIDFDYQSCSKCGWDIDKNMFDEKICREPNEDDYSNGDADILTGHWN